MYFRLNGIARGFGAETEKCFLIYVSDLHEKDARWRMFIPKRMMRRITLGGEYIFSGTAKMLFIEDAMRHGPLGGMYPVIAASFFVNKLIEVK